MQGYVPEDGTGDIIVRNSVFWENKDGIFMISQYAPPLNVLLSKLTVGNNARYAIRSNVYTDLQVNISTSLIQAPSGQTMFKDPISLSSSFIYLEPTAILGTSSTGFTQLETTTYNSTLLHLPRVESGSSTALAGAGANILYRIGGTGTFHGDSGWDAISLESLWPFEGESIWANKMKSYTSSGSGGNRGFANITSEIPLTDYIWGYLGNPKPSIY
jgi:hypothetical protein